MHADLNTHVYGAAGLESHCFHASDVYVIGKYGTAPPRILVDICR